MSTVITAPTTTDDHPSAPTGGNERRPVRRRFAEIGLTAVLAAAVGSGATLASVGLLPTDASATTVATTTAAGTSTSAGAPTTAVDGVSWTQVAAAASPSVVAIEVSGAGGEGQGSGVVWDDAGHVVTNNHVVSGLGDGAQISVRVGQQTSYRATLVGTDPTTDLAVLKIDSPPADLAPLARSEEAVLVGDPVMALGNPLGLSGTVTTGIVSAVDRPTSTAAVSSGDPFTQASTATSDVVVTNAIQTSAAINPGNSGGALVDAQGRLVGINSSIASMPTAGGGQSGNIGIGFAIPVDEVSGVVTQLIDHGSATHAALGIGVTDASVPQGSATVSGAGIQQVQADGAGAAAGLRSGDVITAVDGDAVTSAEALIGQVRSRAAGEVVTLTLLRDGSEQTVDVTLATRDQS